MNDYRFPVFFDFLGSCIFILKQYSLQCTYLVFRQFVIHVIAQKIMIYLVSTQFSVHIRLTRNIQLFLLEISIDFRYFILLVNFFYL